MSFKDELLCRAETYAEQNGLVLVEELGFGVHGIVLAAESKAETGRVALKMHGQEVAYFRERDVYLRLMKHRVKMLRGCYVPQLRRYDDDLLILDMTVVTRPFVLDFGGAYLDHAPDFSEEVMADWRDEKIEQFGKQWPPKPKPSCGSWKRWAFS
jgi:hypothetical protein